MERPRLVVTLVIIVAMVAIITFAVRGWGKEPAHVVLTETQQAQALIVLNFGNAVKVCKHVFVEGPDRDICITHAKAVAERERDDEWVKEIIRLKRIAEDKEKAKDDGAK